MAEITFISHTRAGGFRPGIHTAEDSPKIRWLLKSDRFELIDPPCLSWLDNPEKADKPLQEEVEAANGIGTSDHQTATAIQPSGPAGGSGPGEKSEERSAESESDRPSSKRGPSRLTKNSKDEG